MISFLIIRKSDLFTQSCIIFISFLYSFESYSYIWVIILLYVKEFHYTVGSYYGKIKTIIVVVPDRIPYPLFGSFSVCPKISFKWVHEKRFNRVTSFLEVVRWGFLFPPWSWNEFSFHSFIILKYDLFSELRILLVINLFHQ